MRLLALSLLTFGLACAPVEQVTGNLAGVDGTVAFLNIEGGCWAIRVGDVNYEPTNLATEFKQDGLRVRVTMQTLDNAGSFCMIGPIVQINSIARR